MKQPVKRGADGDPRRNGPLRNRERITNQGPGVPPPPVAVLCRGPRLTGSCGCPPLNGERAAILVHQGPLDASFCAAIAQLPCVALPWIFRQGLVPPLGTLVFWRDPGQVRSRSGPPLNEGHATIQSHQGPLV